MSLTHAHTVPQPVSPGQSVKRGGPQLDPLVAHPAPGSPMNRSVRSVGSVRTGGPDMGLTQAGGAGFVEGRLAIRLWFEVVNEDDFVHLFRESLATCHIPLPRVFIPPEDLPEGYQMDPLAHLPRPSPAGQPCEALSSSVKAVEQEILLDLFGRMFGDIVQGHEVQETIASLPKEAKVPLYEDIRQKTSLLVRLEKAFARFDVDSSGQLNYKEIKRALVRLGMKARSAETKDFLRSLDRNLDGEVDLREFVANCPQSVQLAIEEALGVLEQAEQQKEREERKLEGMDDADKAALAIQGRVRTLKAKKQVEYQRFMATPEGQEQHKAAIKMQNLQRKKAARQHAEERKKHRAHKNRHVALANPTFQNLLVDMMENTMHNLIDEALHGEFDLSAQYKQLKMAKESHLS